MPLLLAGPPLRPFGASLRPSQQPMLQISELDLEDLDGYGLMESLEYAASGCISLHIFTSGTVTIPV